MQKQSLNFYGNEFLALCAICAGRSLSLGQPSLRTLAKLNGAGPYTEFWLTGKMMTFSAMLYAYKAGLVPVLRRWLAHGESPPDQASLQKKVDHFNSCNHILSTFSF